MDACFISNHKRMDIIERDIKPLNQTFVIVTSNIPKTEKNNYLYVDYNNYLIPDDLISDNAGLMLLHASETVRGGRSVFWRASMVFTTAKEKIIIVMI